MLSKDNHPRLLVVSPSAFNYLSGGGVTFTNLFYGWPKDRIACAHSDYVEPSNDVCEKYYFLGQKEFKWIFPFSLANFFGGQERMEKSLRKTKNRHGGGTFFSKTAKIFLSSVQKIFGKEIPVKENLSCELRKWIAEFKPQVIYTILGNLQYIRLVRKIAREFNIPVVVHMMDDWPRVIYKSGIFGPFRRLRMNIELKRIMKEAAACLGICDAMSKEYKKRFGRKFLSFHNAVDADHWLKNSKKDWGAQSPFSIIYAGALMPDSQLQSVADFSNAIEKLCKEGLDIEFKIYAPWYFANQYKEQLERGPCARVFEMPEKMDVESLFSRADLLLLPVNFDKASVKYIRYSMPTKVCAYMFSGTPTLAYGPKSVASISYAQNWAYCVMERDRNKLCAAIRKLFSDRQLRQDLALHAQKMAKERHDRKTVSAAFQKILIEAAQR